jgi:hypothetical protein
MAESFQTRLLKPGAFKESLSPRSLRGESDVIFYRFV